MKKRTTLSQKDMILAHMGRGLSITPMEAAERFNCWRLAARISELRDVGWDIQTGDLTLYGKHTARYHMNKAEQARWRRVSFYGRPENG